MKRLLAFIIVTAIISAGFAMPSMAASSTDKAVSLLAGIGILRGDGNGNYFLEDSVSRAEFTAFVVRIMNMEDIDMSNLNTFNDVPNSHWAAKTIQTAVSMGLIEGVGNGNFEPDREVALDEAVKVLVTALGYSQPAQKAGGYPQGYQKYGIKMNLYKELPKTDKYLTRAATCVLIYNALQAEIYDQTEDVIKGTMLEEYLNFTTIKGTINATPFYHNGQKLNRGTIVIDGNVYLCDDPYVDEYIGCECVAYTLADRGETVIKYIQLIGDTKSFTVSAEDICPETNLSKFVYYEGDEKKSIALDRNLTVFYDSDAVSPENQSAATLIPVKGCVILRDGNGDGQYDIVLVEEYTDYVVQYISEDVVYGKFGEKLDLSENEKIVVLKDGKEIGVEDIKNGDVLSAVVSPDGERTKIYVSDESAQGYIKYITDYTGSTIYGLEDSKTSEEISLRLSKDYLDAQASGKYGTVKLKIDPNKKIRVYFNKFGFVSDVTELYKGDTLQYGWLVATSWKNDTIEPRGAFKILTLANRYEVFTNRDGEKIKYGNNQGVITKEEASYVAEKMKYPKQLVKYRLDEDGYLVEIQQFDTRTRTDYFSKGPVDTELMYYNDGVFGNRFYIDQNTAVFAPAQSLDSLSSAGSYMTTLKNGQQRYCTFYDLEGSYAKAVVLSTLFGTVYDDTEKTGYEVILDYVNSPIFYINSINYREAEDGATYMYLKGYEAGKEKSIYVANTIKPNSEPKSNLKPGIAIQYEDNKINLTRAETAEDPRQILVFKTVHDFTASPSSDIYWEYGKLESTRSQITTLWGEVKSVMGEHYTVNAGEVDYTARIHENTMVLKFDKEKNTFEKATLDDISTGLNLFIRQRYQNSREAVIY